MTVIVYSSISKGNCSKNNVLMVSRNIQLIFEAKTSEDYTKPSIIMLNNYTMVLRTNHHEGTPALHGRGWNCGHKFF